MNTVISSPEEIRRRGHVVAVPYPGRGHINPMLNLCNLLSSKNPHLLITVVVTEEWHGFLSTAGSIFSGNIQLASIPNVIPSELVRGSDFPAFYTAVMTEMETPVDELLDRISNPPITALISDTELRWAIRIGNRRKIPVATLCTVPAGVFSVFHRFAAIQDFKLRDSVLDEEEMGYRPSNHEISPSEIADLKAIFRGDDRRIMGLTLECISWVPKAQYLLVNSVQDLEPESFDALKSELKLPIYPIGPAIPFYQLNHNNTNTSESAHAYFNWLESQPEGSVLYVSLGSFLSISSKQIDELAEGLLVSSVRFLWVVRGDQTERARERCGEKGMVVPWCDQMKVLNHCSVGGFLTHCGWNSMLEAIYCGVAMLTFPLIFDQVPNSRRIVEKWKVGWRLKRDVAETEEDELVNREEICDTVTRFMDGEESEVKEMRKRGKELREVCRGAIAEGGSSDKNLDEFIKEISGAS
uniref:UDP-glycosyltransferase 1 n=1 Tax=Linum usitatissimum TaxID=4006 RepID=I2BHC0_LINUS|nr:UDP-glycosyltransferase 1 [Linum usitatissimum]